MRLGRQERQEETQNEDSFASHSERRHGQQAAVQLRALVATDESLPLTALLAL